MSHELEDLILEVMDRESMSREKAIRFIRRAVRDDLMYLTERPAYDASVPKIYKKSDNKENDL